MTIAAPAYPLKVSQLVDYLGQYTDTAIAALSTVDATSYGADKTGAADSSAAVLAAIAASNGRAVYFPAGTYKVALGTLTTSGNLTMIGDGKASSIIQFTGTPPDNADVHGVQTTGVGSTIMLRGLKLAAPTLANAVSTVTGVFHRSASSGTVVVEDCHIVGFTYQIRTWDGGTHRVIVTRSRIEGMGGTMVYPSMGIHVPGGAGAEIIARNCDFLNTGMTSDPIHNHCLYLFEPVSYDIEGCSFDHVKGRYIQCFGMPAASGHTTDRPTYGRITRCVFGSDIPTTTEGVITNTYIHTKFEGCTFLHPGKAIQLEGPATFTACDFSATAATSFYATIYLNGTSLRVAMIGCYMPLNQEYFFRIDQANNRVIVTDCHFTGTVSFWFSLEAGSAGSIVKIQHSFLSGGQTLGVEANACLVQALDAVTIEVRGTTFGHVNNAIRATVTTYKAYLFMNDLSMTGVAVKGSIAATKKYLGNYGSVGLADA